MIKEAYVRNALITNVVDGDTFDALIDLGFGASIKERFRINGINAPEITGEEKYKGIISKNYLSSRILNKNVIIVSTKTDSFRRWLADIYVTDDKENQISIANEMFQKGFAEYRNFN